MTAIIPISYTSLSKWLQCPRHWAVVYKKKIKDTGNKATFQGSADHDALEQAVKTGSPTPDAFSQKIVNQLRAAPGRAEAEKWLTVDRQLNYAPYGTTPYIRVKTDVLHTNEAGTRIAIIDWKCGAWAPNTAADVDYMQLRMTAIAAFGVKKKAEAATVSLVYTQKKKIYPLVIQRSEVTLATRSPEFVKLFNTMAEHEAAQSGTEFKAIPGRACNFCPDATCPHHPGYDS